MTRDVIVLPSKIPERLFKNLNGNVHEEIRRSIRAEYEGIEKITLSDAGSPQDALGHYFHRSFGNGRSANCFTKMFSPIARDHAFQPEIPEKPYIDDKGNPLTARDSKTFREMELALELSREKPYDASSFYRVASEILARH